MLVAAAINRILTERRYRSRGGRQRQRKKRSAGEVAQGDALEQSPAPGDAEQHVIARVSQAESDRRFDRRFRRYLPGDDGGDVMAGVLRAKLLAGAQTAVD